MEEVKVLELASAYLERIGEAENAAIAYEAYVEVGKGWEVLVKAAKAYLRMYQITKDLHFVEKAYSWLEEALLIREGKEIYYYLGIASLLLGRTEEVDKYLENFEDFGEDMVLKSVVTAIEARKKEIASEGLGRLKDPFLINLYTFLRNEVEGDLVENLKSLYERIFLENALSLKDAESKVAALIYFLVRGYTAKEIRALSKAIRDGVVDVEKLPPYTRHLIRRFLKKYRPRSLPFFLRENLERLNALGERLTKLEKDPNPSKTYQEVLKEIRKEIGRFKKKASLVLTNAQIKDILKLYISTLPIDDEEKFSLLEML